MREQLGDGALVMVNCVGEQMVMRRARREEEDVQRPTRGLKEQRRCKKDASCCCHHSREAEHGVGAPGSGREGGSDGEAGGGAVQLAGYSSSFPFLLFFQNCSKICITSSKSSRIKVVQLDLLYNFAFLDLTQIMPRF